MNPDMYKAAKRLFAMALDLPNVEQEEFVRKECNGDEALLSLVQELLHNDAHAGSFLQAPLQPFGFLPGNGEPIRCTRECTVCGHCFDSGELTCPSDSAAL